MKTSKVKTVLAFFVLPGLAGFLVFVISYVADRWECEIPGCTHLFKQALMLPNHYAWRAVEWLLSPLLAVVDEFEHLWLVFAGCAIGWTATGIIVGQIIRCLRPRAA